MQLVTEILAAYFPLKALLARARVARLPDPFMSIRQGDTEPVSKSPLGKSEPDIAPNAGSAGVKLRSTRSMKVMNLTVPVRSIARFFPSIIVSPGASQPETRP